MIEQRTNGKEGKPHTISEGEGANYTRPNFRASLETSLVCNAIRELPVGGVLPYGRAAEIAGTDIQTVKRRLRSVDDILLREGVKIGRIRGVGIKRLSESEHAEKLADRTHRAHNAGRRAERLYVATNFAALSDNERIDLNANMAAMRAVKTVTAPKSVRQIAANTTATDVLAIGKTLSLFGGN